MTETGTMGGGIDRGSRTAPLRGAATAVLLALAGQQAAAADLGGSCCADLEERVADLEATSVRKGNRKVSLTVSGWISQAVFFWDDGRESNVYVGTNSLEQDRFRVVGDAKLSDGWSAGYVLEIGTLGADSKAFSQDDDGAARTVLVRKSYWYVKSKDLGKLEVGMDGTATYHVIDDVDFLQTRNVSDYEAAAVALGKFKIRSNGNFVNGLAWTDILGGVNNATPGQNGRRNIVRYDTAEFAGLVGTASWGEDDQWGLALTFKKEIGDVKVAAKAGYEESTDSDQSACNKVAADQDCHWWGAGVTVQHMPTGLYVYGGYGLQEDSAEERLEPLADGTDRVWYVQLGIEQTFVGLGKTTMFGEYRHDDVGSNLGKSLLDDDTFVRSAEADFWSLGVVQAIEKADMILYAVYRRVDGDAISSAGELVSLDDFQMVETGGKINF